MSRVSTELRIRFKPLLENLGFKLDKKGETFVRQTPESTDSLCLLVSHKFAFKHQLTIYL